MQLRSLAAALGASVLVFSGNTAFAVDEPVAPPAEVTPAPGPTLVTVLGTGITLSIGTDAAGHLTAVDLTGSAAAGAVATEVSPHEVKFVIGDGSTKVEVETKGTSIKTEVETSALENLVGLHTWRGELFGVEGGATEITFTIGDDGGVPTISLVSVSGPGSGTPPAVTSSTDSDDDESEAKLRIELSDSGHEARVTIKVEVEDEDGHAHAELKISARSDLFAVEEAVGPVAVPVVNAPMSEQAHDDDHDEDHDSDHHEDEAHEDDRDDDYDEEHDSDRDEDEAHEDDRDDDDDEDHDEDHDDDHDDERSDREGHERGDHDDDDD